MHLFIVPLYFFHLLSRRSNNQFIKSDLWSPETKLWEQIRSQVHVPPLPPLRQLFLCLCGRLSEQVTSQVSLQDAGDSLVQRRAWRGPGRGCRGALQALKLQDAVDGALQMFTEHVVLLERGRRRAEPLLRPRRRIQPVAFQFWCADISGRQLVATSLWLWHRKRVWGFYFGIGRCLWDFLCRVTRQSSVGDLLVVLRMLGCSVGCLRVAFVHSSAAVGQLPHVVPLESGVAGRVVDHLTGAGLLLDGEPESPAGAGAVRLQSRRPIWQSGGPGRRRGRAARGDRVGGAGGGGAMRGRRWCSQGHHERLWRKRRWTEVIWTDIIKNPCWADSSAETKMVLKGQFTQITSSKHNYSDLQTYKDELCFTNLYHRLHLTFILVVIESGPLLFTFFCLNLYFSNKNPLFVCTILVCLCNICSRTIYLHQCQ